MFARGADINGDQTVDYKDLAILAAAYGMRKGDLGYNEYADLNRDGIIDYKDLAILAANYGTQMSTFVDYTVFIDSVDGKKVKARNGLTSMIDFSGTDPAAVLQSTVDALARTGGTILLKPGTYVWQSVPALPKDLPHWLKVIGEGEVTIQLTEKGPRAFDLRKTADYGTFQYIWLEGFTVDCNGVGGRNHVVFGTYVSGNRLSRINIQDIKIRNIKTINVPVDPTIATYRLNIGIVVTHLAAGETQTNIQRILIEDCDFHGGNYGIGIEGSGILTTGLNVFLDDINIYRCRHTLGSVQASQFDSANFHVGSLGFGGSCHISDCFGQYSGDVGIEVNAFTTAVVENCIIEDSTGAAYYHTNYNNPLKANEQKITMRDCVARKIAVSGAVESYGFECVGSLSVPLGAVTVENCTFRSAVRDYAPSDVPGEALRAFSKSGFRFFSASGFKAIYDSISYAAPGNKWFRPVSLHVPSGTFNASLRDVEIVARGTKQVGSGSLGITAVGVDGNDVHMSFDNIIVDYNIANIDAGNMYGMDIGYEKSTVEGTIRRFRVRQMMTDREPRGIIVEGKATLTINTQIIIENCDFSAMPANGVEVLFTGGARSNQDKTYLYGNVWIPRSR